MEQEVKLGMKKARLVAGLTLKEASDLLGISKRTLNDYENDKTKPRIDIAFKIADIYNIEFTRIFFVE